MFDAMQTREEREELELWAVDFILIDPVHMAVVSQRRKWRELRQGEEYVMNRTVIYLIANTGHMTATLVTTRKKTAHIIKSLSNRAELI